MLGGCPEGKREPVVDPEVHCRGLPLGDKNWPTGSTVRLLGPVCFAIAYESKCVDTIIAGVDGAQIRTRND